MGSLVNYIADGARKVCIGATVGLAALVGSSGESRADYIQFANVPHPSVSGISGSSAVIETYDHPDTSMGYDRFDHDRIPLPNPNKQLFTTYTTLVDADSNEHLVSYSFVPEFKVGDTYIFNLAFEDTLGIGTYSKNAVLFSDMNLGDSDVNDFMYSISVDTDVDGINDHFETGLVSEIMATPDQTTAYWDQLVLGGLDLNNVNYHYGEITFTAVEGPKCADFNKSGYVDDADLNLLLSDFGGNVRDLNYDGVVNEMDLKIVIERFGGDCGHVGSSSFVKGVPEPSSGVLLGVGAFACLAGMRRWGRDSQGGKKRDLRDCDGLDSVVL